MTAIAARNEHEESSAADRIDMAFMEAETLQAKELKRIDSAEENTRKKENAAAIAEQNKTFDASFMELGSSKKAALPPKTPTCNFNPIVVTPAPAAIEGRDGRAQQRVLAGPAAAEDAARVLF